MTSVIIFCEGTKKHSHERCLIARYDRPFLQGNERIDTWGPVRVWRHGDSDLIVLPEFERWVTDDDPSSEATGLSLSKPRRLYRYRCGLCKPKPYDEQHHTHNLEFDVKGARNYVLDTLAAHGIDEISVRGFVERWRNQIPRTRRRH